ETLRDERSGRQRQETAGLKLADAGSSVDLADQRDRLPVRSEHRRTRGWIDQDGRHGLEEGHGDRIRRQRADDDARSSSDELVQHLAVGGRERRKRRQPRGYAVRGRAEEVIAADPYKDEGRMQRSDR